MMRPQVVPVSNGVPNGSPNAAANGVTNGVRAAGDRRVPGVTEADPVSEFVLVYDADGTLTGEMKYAMKKLLGLGHCPSCAISHGKRAEKPEFIALKQAGGGWSVPVRNIHRDEMDAGLESIRSHVPCLAARTATGACRVLLDAHALEECGGDVYVFREALDKAIVRHRLQMPPAPACALPLPLPTTTLTERTRAKTNGDAVVPGS